MQQASSFPRTILTVSLPCVCRTDVRTHGRTDGVGPAAFPTLKPLPPPPRRSQMKVRGKENQQRERGATVRSASDKEIGREGGSGKKRWRRFPRDPLLYLCGTISRRSLLSSSLLPPRPSRQFYDDRTLSAKAIMVGFLALASLCLRPPLRFICLGKVVRVNHQHAMQTNFRPFLSLRCQLRHRISKILFGHLFSIDFAL